MRSSGYPMVWYPCWQPEAWMEQHMQFLSQTEQQHSQLWQLWQQPWQPNEMGTSMSQEHPVWQVPQQQGCTGGVMRASAPVFQPGVWWDSQGPEGSKANPSQDEQQEQQEQQEPAQQHEPGPRNQIDSPQSFTYVAGIGRRFVRNGRGPGRAERGMQLEAKSNFDGADDGATLKPEAAKIEGEINAVGTAAQSAPEKVATEKVAAEKFATEKVAPEKVAAERLGTGQPTREKEATNNKAAEEACAVPQTEKDSCSSVSAISTPSTVTNVVGSHSTDSSGGGKSNGKAPPICTSTTKRQGRSWSDMCDSQDGTGPQSKAANPIGQVSASSGGRRLWGDVEDSQDESDADAAPTPGASIAKKVYEETFPTLLESVAAGRPPRPKASWHGWRAVTKAGKTDKARGAVRRKEV